MQRLITLATIVVLGSVSPTALAAVRNFNSPPAKSPAMTNDQFKSTVDTLSKQTKSNINQQVDQQLTYKPAAPGSSSPSSSTPSTSTSSTTTTFDGTNPGQQPEPPPAPVGSQAQSPRSAPPPPTTLPQPSTPPAMNTPASNDIYTGFGTGQPAPKKDGSGNSQGKTNSNWNMGY